MVNTGVHLPLLHGVLARSLGDVAQIAIGSGGRSKIDFLMFEFDLQSEF